MKSEPIKKQLIVAASQETCFRVFTDAIDRWWPREHHIGKSPLKRAIIEPRAGGRWYSVCQDGTAIDIGKVLIWEPPRRLVVTWQIDGEWKYDPDFITEVEIRFTSEGATSTRVDLEHRNLDRYGPSETEIRKTFEAPGG